MTSHFNGNFFLLYLVPIYTRMHICNNTFLHKPSFNTFDCLFYPERINVLNEGHMHGASHCPPCMLTVLAFQPINREPCPAYAPRCTALSACCLPLVKMPNPLRSALAGVITTRQINIYNVDISCPICCSNLLCSLP